MEAVFIQSVLLGVKSLQNSLTDSPPLQIDIPIPRHTIPLLTYKVAIGYKSVKAVCHDFQKC